jgi:hypothetical protein
VPDGCAFASEPCTVNTREYVLPRSDLKGNCRSLHFLVGPQFYHYTQDSLCLARDANREPPEYKYRVISGFRPEVVENRDLLGSEERRSHKYREPPEYKYRVI